MVKKIEILSTNFNVLLDFEKNAYFFDGKNIDFTVEKLDELLRIIRFWKKNYILNSVLDGIFYEIKIYEENNVDIFTIKNAFPENFILFKQWVGSLNDEK